MKKMEEYTRDSLRQLRRADYEPTPPKKGSKLITFMIILLYLFAGGFYLATEKNISLEEAKETLLGWKDNVVAAMNQKNFDQEIEKAVEEALNKQDGIS